MKKMNIAAIAVTLFLLTAVAFAVMTVKGIRGDASSAVTADGDLTAERAYNVLLLGTDREAGLADVMMLVRLDLAHSKAFIMQIPRDTYAEYTDASYKKLNGAYLTLGAEGTCTFLAEAFGINIDRYIVTGLDSLCAAVDAVGGVDVRVPCDMRYRDSAQGLYIDLKAGVQHLDGALAEQFLRFRSGYIEGDIDRMDAQKIFLAAIAKKIKENISLAMAYRLLEAADGVETNFSATELLELALSTSDIDGEDVQVATLPGAEARAASGASYYGVSADAAAELAQKFFCVGRESFDKKGKLLNEKNASFERIYNGFSAYRVYTLADILEKGIEIDLK